MKRVFTRRDMLKFAGGGLVGAMFSPLPWKLLDDSAIWTQNWGLTPKLTHGPVTSRISRCTLCAGGCAVSARCVSGMPFFLSGVPNDPLSRGGLCSRGIAGHHMAFHPLRITHPCSFSSRDSSGKLVPITVEEGMKRTADSIRNAPGSVVILDQRPNRSLSDHYRRFAETLPEGRYVTSPSDESTMLETLQQMSSDHLISFGYDLESTSLIVSFGAPLLDGWGNSGYLHGVHRRATMIHVESRYSTTAKQADRWIAVRPGTEKFFALSVAYHILQDKGLRSRTRRNVVDFFEMDSVIAQYSADITAQITGIDPAIVRETAEQLLAAVSPVIISSADPGGGPYAAETERIIAFLNVLVGNIGRPGGLTVRTADRMNSTLNDLPDGSISVLIIDGAESGFALPWRAIERKLHPEQRFVLSLSPMVNEYSAFADLLLPTPAPYEVVSDIPAPVCFGRSMTALSAPLLPAVATTVDPFAFVNGIAQQLDIPWKPSTQASALDERWTAMLHHRRGEIHFPNGEEAITVSRVGTVNEIRESLMNGGVWKDDRPTFAKDLQWIFGVHSIVPHQERSMPLILSGIKGMTSSSQCSPISSKIFQESELKPMNGVVSIHPTTAQWCGLGDRRTALLKTEIGTQTVRVFRTPTVRPGVIEAAVGPNPNGADTPSAVAPTTVLDLCPIHSDGTWNGTSATLTRV